MLTYGIIVLLGSCALTHAGLRDLAGDRGINVGTDSQADVPDNFVGCTRTAGAYQAAGVVGEPDKVHECMYYECTNNEWKPKLCQDGIGIAKYRYDKAGRSRIIPCAGEKKACLSSLSDRGVANTATDVCGLDLVIMVDVSCSISDINKGKVKSFLMKFAAQFPIGPAFTQMAGLVYGSTVDNFLFLDSFNSPKLTRDAIRGMPLKAGKCATHTFKALRTAREVHLTVEKGRRSTGKDIRDCMGVLLTDGFTHPQNMSDDTIQEAREFRKECPLLLVTLPNDSDNDVEEKTELRNKEFQAIQPDEDYRLDMTEFDELDESINNIARKTCQRV